ncbi:MAG: DUF1501 domain-containing protein [Solirubrobacteraceae bacterium]
MSSSGCSGFTRSEMIRRGLAAPGAGLPSIEPGMPLPAGTGLSRRSLMLRGAGLALAVYGADKLVPGAFEEGIAEAAAAPDAPVLISIFMSGGADGLNILAPTEGAAYQRLRPNIRLSSASTLAVAGSDEVRWHPAMAGIKALHDAGKVVVAPAIGYDSPNQSHFTSRHFWEVGKLDTNGATGWLGRYLDAYGQVNNPIQGLSLDGTLSPTLATANVAVAATSSPTSYTFDSPGVWNAGVKDGMLGAFGALGSAPAHDPIMAQARQAQANAAGLRSQLAQTPKTGGGAYPNTGFAKKLQNVARMLRVGLPMRCVTLGAPGGYDTHSNQAGSLQTGLQQTSDGIAAFQADLEASGLADRVLIHLWSEFGRRPQENDLGTDHGAAGVSFVIGSRANGGFLGEHPGLTSLDAQGNLRNTSDFRDLYRALLEQWLGADSAAIIPGRSGAVPVLVR